ncbi:MAG: sigma-70 family RNA polymerase sigma factor [Anaerolineae bacterium]|nr:sigma-70 family RNA polymerase sigma factor [Anaerolineae bacterium]
MSQRGKYEILAQHYSEYLPRVLNYMRLRTDNEALAQDLTARTFERALSRLSSLRDAGAFGGWLFAIARTEVAGHYRRHRPQLPLESAYGCPTPGESAEGQVVQSEELANLVGALASLQAREQEIIRLKFIAGLTNRAIGKAMGLRAGNVAVILHRALRKLRTQLESED